MIPRRARRELSEIVAWRRANQPGGQNAGSVFVNPIPHELSAGKLIDDLGLRGLRHGTAAVSDKHANFIQADPGGSADDVRALMELVRERVATATGHSLRSEIRLIGFEEASEMSRWRRKSKDAASSVDGAGDEPVFSDVKIVKREPEASETDRRRVDGARDRW